MEFHLDHIFTQAGLISLITLAFLEIILGIDNIIFISIIAGKLPRTQQRQARIWGLGLALIMRLGLLTIISIIATMVKPLFMIGDHGVSGRDLILFAGGTFLIYKSIAELIEKVADKHDAAKDLKQRSLAAAIVQIIIIDLVFSFDSILTAVAMSNDLAVMMSAVVIAMIVMLLFSAPISDFINRNPGIKILALVFLVAIGVVLVVDSVHFHLDKAYFYVAMGFSLIVELLNMRMRKNMAKHHVKE